jgi:hypothetical protein
MLGRTILVLGLALLVGGYALMQYAEHEQSANPLESGRRAAVWKSSSSKIFAAGGTLTALGAGVTGFGVAVILARRRSTLAVPPPPATPAWATCLRWGGETLSTLSLLAMTAAWGWTRFMVWRAEIAREQKLASGDELERALAGLEAIGGSLAASEHAPWSSPLFTWLFWLFFMGVTLVIVSYMEMPRSQARPPGSA